MRAIGPNPGKNPNKVGDRPALNCIRLPFCTQSPPVKWFRTMNGPADVWFTIAIPGCSFHVPVNSDGRLSPVCQSTCRLEVREYSRQRRPPGTVESGLMYSWRGLFV